MMPKIEAPKNESKSMKIDLPITFEPLIYPHDFLKSLKNKGAPMVLPAQTSK
jgi:hypothetical protein